MIKAVLFDFGGVVVTSPFDAFAKYEEANGLPVDLIRTINSTNADTNAWAHYERGTLVPARFAELFEAEARQRGHVVDGLKILALIGGDVRQPMVDAIQCIKEAGFIVACLTNNFKPWGLASEEIRKVMKIFDEVVESSKIGVRKPEQQFYTVALGLLGIEAHEAVFLDDLGVNLKPARELGMTTIKVLSMEQALADLGPHVGLDLSPA